jgi:vancomycin resistance protein YoaR
MKWLALPIVILILVVGTGLVFELSYENKFYPGVSIAGIPVGGKTFADVLDHFKNEERVLQEAGLRVNLQSGSTTTEVTIPPFVRGFTPDKVLPYYALENWEKTIREAYEFGRKGSWGQKLREQRAGLVTGIQFSLPPIIYEESVRSLISQELESFLKKPVPAQFALNKKGELYIVPEKVGESIDPDEVLAAVKERVLSLDSTPIRFRATGKTPFATEAKLEPLLPFARALALQANITFRYESRWWRARGGKFSTWLELKDETELSINREKLEGFISEAIRPDLDDPAQNSRFEIRAGTLTEITPGKAGSVIDTGRVEEKVGRAISDIQESFALTGDLVSAMDLISSGIQVDPKTGTITIPIEMIVQNPKVTAETVDQYEIKDLVGFSRTSFKGSSEDRKTNIRVGVSSLNGLLIAPGEELSTVNAIGYVTEEAGYVKEYVIKENESVKELGGGLCQIGTTLFRLVLNAGLPVTERVNHRYVVGYYGPGLDATIYGPHPDLRFVNDTGHYLLLQGRIEGTDVVFELYGQKDGRSASTSDPILSDRIPAPETKYVSAPDLPLYTEKCSETPREGMTANVTYRVSFPDGKVREQIFNSVYQPWQKICLIGTKI